VALSRVGERREARDALEEAIEPAVRLFGFSGAAADFLFAHPEEAALLTELRSRSREVLLPEVEGDVARLGPESGLRRFRRRAVFRLAARDLGGAPLEEVLSEMTAIAEVCLEVASVSVGRSLAMIGMGKLGGAELNYASDVDLIFVHLDGDPETAVRSASGVVGLLSQPTEEGVALRVDTTLRPEGRAGPLSRSVSSTIEYYRRHAATWERQALLKARPVAGAIETGARLLEELAPVVYPDHLEPSAIDDVRQMKVRIEDYVRARGKDAVEVKRGRGGIRDVEFAVQLLQLVHGRRDAGLRQPNTLRALAVLGEEGYVSVGDSEELASSYRFLRTLEHRLQLARDLPTHELPADEPSLRRLARSMGLEDAGALRGTYEAHTDTVRGLHQRLFYRPLLEAFAGPRVPRPGIERAATEELLSGLGFTAPEPAYERLDRLVDPSSRLGKVLGHVFPVMAPALALAADPDQALVRLERIGETLKEQSRVPDLIASDPGIARRLALIAGASSWLTDLLIRQADAIQAVLHPVAGVHTLETEAALLAAGSAYVGGVLSVPDSGRTLARIADAVVQEALTKADPDLPFAVIGLGHLGGEELNFASDLDLVFVFEGEGGDAFAEAEAVGAGVLEAIRLAGFEGDADLRPEGRSGPLARSIAAYLEYWQRWGQTWEFQSLLKARLVAGDEALGRRFLSIAEDFAYPEMLPLEKIAEIRRMRVRMESERVRPPDARRFHFKLGYGGLADVQFAVELQLMKHGRAHPGIRHRHTLMALEALAQERLVEDSVALALGDAYVFLNEVKNALEIDRRVRAEAIPPTLEGQRDLARRLGYEESPRFGFLEDYRRITRRARGAMERVFYGEES
jgi:glutamate-ammonia-ligase adenylyltransferase